MRFASESALFGNEKDDSFRGSIAGIYQAFGGVEIYSSPEEKEMMINVIMNCMTASDCTEA